MRRMIRTPFWSLPALSLLLTPAVFAQSVSYSGYYNGPRVDVNFIQNPPAQYQECREKYINSTARIYSACSFGVDEARRMAERFGGGKGRIEGYLRGFSWGLYSSVQSNRASADAMAIGAALNADLLGRIERASLEGSTRGKSAGETRGASEARKRFTSALDSGMNPIEEIGAIPPSAFSSRYQDPYSSLIGKPQTLDDMLKQPVEDLSQIRVYDSYDSVFLGDVPRFNLFDYYFSDGTYRFEMARWVDPQAAIQQWLNRPIDTKPQYEALGTDTVQVAIQNPKPGEPATRAETIQLKEIFRKSFVNAYGWYVNYYFSQNFYTQLDLGQRTGEAIGKQVGLRYARESGEVKAFNQKFQRDERAAYDAVFADSYRNGFLSTFRDHASNPKPEVDGFDIIGELDDGILQPGERIAVSFRIKNYGKVATNGNAFLEGVQNALYSKEIAIPALRSTEVRTDFIGSISNSVQNSATLNIGLTLSGKGFGAFTVLQNARVMRQVTPIGIEIKTLAPTGQAIVAFNVRNHSRMNSSSSVRVVLRDSLGRTLEENLGIIAGNQTSTAQFQLDGYSPLDLIRGPGITVRGQMFLGDLVIGELGGTILSKDPVGDLARAFAEQSQDATRSDLVRALQAELVDRITGETTNMERQGYERQGDSTYLQQTLNAYRGKSQNSVAREAYASMARALWPARKAFTNFIGIKSCNRKFFEAAVRELNGGKKL
jgi:hypothetical protein